MINYLFSKGVTDAGDLLQEFMPSRIDLLDNVIDENQPLAKEVPPKFDELAEKTFELASIHLSENEVFTCIQNWIKEENSGSSTPPWRTPTRLSPTSPMPSSAITLAVWTSSSYGWPREGGYVSPFCAASSPTPPTLSTAPRVPSAQATSMSS